jgi:RimK family alpha-L-glutamate ligase
MAAAWRRLGVDAHVVAPATARDELRSGDVAVVRLDVRPTLDGIEEGLAVLPALRARGVRIVNRSVAMRAAHDKLLTLRHLERAGVAHPRTRHVWTAAELRRLPLPFVVKPRFGSWGQDVLRCRTDDELDRCLALILRRPWFDRQGALVQELLPVRGSDLRVVVAGGRAVGACCRFARPGEWRTNVSLGGSLVPLPEPTADECKIAVAAVQALRGDLLGVDILEDEDGRPVILEVNGAPDFDERYSLDGRDVFRETAAALGLLRPEGTRALGRGQGRVRSVQAGRSCLPLS